MVHSFCSVWRRIAGKLGPRPVTHIAKNLSRIEGHFVTLDPGGRAPASAPSDLGIPGHAIVLCLQDAQRIPIDSTAPIVVSTDLPLAVFIHASRPRTCDDACSQGAMMTLRVAEFSTLPQSRSIERFAGSTFAFGHIQARFIQHAAGRFAAGIVERVGTAS